MNPSFLLAVLFPVYASVRVWTICARIWRETIREAVSK